MFKIFQYIGYALQAKKGLEKPDELISDISFGFMEVYFIISFVCLGAIVLVTGFLGFYFDSTIFIIISVLLLLALCVDIFIYRRVKNFFQKIGSHVVDVSKDIQQKIIHKNTNLE